jgi:hypothetical protein
MADGLNDLFDTGHDNVNVEGGDTHGGMRQRNVRGFDNERRIVRRISTWKSPPTSDN